MIGQMVGTAVVVLIIYYTGRYSCYLDNIIFNESEEEPFYRQSREVPVNELFNNIEDSQKWKAYAVNLKTQIISAIYTSKGIKKSDEYIAKEALSKINEDFPKFCKELADAMEDDD